MALKVPNAAELLLIDKLRTELLQGATLRLFSNDKTPADADVLANYVETTFTGYAGIVLNAWAAVFTNVVGSAQSDEINRVFTQTAVTVVDNVFGYYVVSAAGALLFAERNIGGVVAMNAVGKTFTVLPRFTLKSEL